MDISPEDVSAHLTGRPPPQPVAELVVVALPIRSAPKVLQPILTPRPRDVPQTVELLCDRHGEANARKFAGREQRLALQKRSRSKFVFWAAVMAEIESRRGIPPEDRKAE